MVRTKASSGNQTSSGNANTEKEGVRYHPIHGAGFRFDPPTPPQSGTRRGVTGNRRRKTQQTNVYMHDERKRERKKKGNKPHLLSKIIPLHLERLPVLQIPLHDLEHRIRKTHAQQRVRDLGVPVDLTQLEKRPCDQRRILSGDGISSTSALKITPGSSPSSLYNPHIDMQPPVSPSESSA